jgi:DMSO/TMAO reductase YedYZ molybdopterin-dependent catalytic subunit
MNLNNLPEDNEPLKAAGPVEKTIRKKTIRSLFFLILFLGSCIGCMIWIYHQPKDNRAFIPLRKVLNFNEKVFGSIFSNRHLTKSYPVANAAKKVRVNGWVGLGNDFDTADWKLQLIRAPGDTIYLTLKDIKALPKTDVVFDFKCIEGWSQVSLWAGVKFSDFMSALHLENLESMKYAGLHTPDGKYYVGIDMKSMLHPQTILCYEMNGKPLPLDQGAPLRLIIPVKYGVKHIKRIGTIYFGDERPPDYWFERGYDYYCGL